MATGASTADLAVILIDARLGIQTQSKRHAFIVSLLGVPRIVVAVNKMDLVGFDRGVFERIRDEYSAFAARLRLRRPHLHPDERARRRQRRHPQHPYAVVRRPPAPAASGIGLHRGRRQLRRLPISGAARRPARPGLSGATQARWCRASCAPATRSWCCPRADARALHASSTLGPDRDNAFPPQSVTLCLDDDVDVSRGDLIAHPNNVPRVERSVEAMVVWMDDEAPLAAGRIYLVKHTTRTVKATCSADRLQGQPRHAATRVRGQPCAQRDRPRALHAVPAAVRGRVPQEPRDRRLHRHRSRPPTRPSAAGMIIERKATPESHRRDDRRARQPQRVRGSASKVDARRAGARAGTEAADRLAHRPVRARASRRIAHALERRLIEAGHACFVLDGDNLRHGLNRDLGFSPEDRRENVRRVAETARLMNDAGLIVITALISPYARIARWRGGSSATSDSSRPTCPRTSTRASSAIRKGLYAKARRGEIAEFTGVNAPYEIPRTPAIDARHRGGQRRAVRGRARAVLARSCEARAG